MTEMNKKQKKTYDVFDFKKIEQLLINKFNEYNKSSQSDKKIERKEEYLTEFIKNYYKERNIQMKIGKEENKTGASRLYSRLQKGNGNIYFLEVIALCHFFGISLKDLLNPYNPFISANESINKNVKYFDDLTGEGWFKEIMELEKNGFYIISPFPSVIFLYDIDPNGTRNSDKRALQILSGDAKSNQYYPLSSLLDFFFSPLSPSKKEKMQVIERIVNYKKNNIFIHFFELKKFPRFERCPMYELFDIPDNKFTAMLPTKQSFSGVFENKMIRDAIYREIIEGENLLVQTTHEESIEILKRIEPYFKGNKPADYLDGIKFFNEQIKFFEELYDKEIKDLKGLPDCDIKDKKIKKAIKDKKQYTLLAEAILKNLNPDFHKIIDVGKKE